MYEDNPTNIQIKCGKMKTLPIKVLLQRTRFTSIICFKWVDWVIIAVVQVQIQTIMRANIEIREI